LFDAPIPVLLALAVTAQTYLFCRIPQTSKSGAAISLHGSSGRGQPGDNEMEMDGTPDNLIGTNDLANKQKNNIFWVASIQTVIHSEQVVALHQYCQ
jgi:hypothetical protein